MFEASQRKPESDIGLKFCRIEDNFFFMCKKIFTEKSLVQEGVR